MDVVFFVSFMSCTCHKKYVPQYPIKTALPSKKLIEHGNIMKIVLLCIHDGFSSPCVKVKEKKNYKFAYLLGSSNDKK